MRSLLFDSMTYLQQKPRFRIRVEVRVRVEDPCLERTGRQMARSKGFLLMPPIKVRVRVRVRVSVRVKLERVPFDAWVPPHAAVSPEEAS